MQDQIYTTWLPLVIVLLFGAIGLVRGVMREAVVAATVVLAAFINLQWADQWSQGLYSVFTRLDQGQQQFILSLIVLWLIVAVVGYGLSVVLPKQPVTRNSRVAGGLLGLISGAAVAGLTLRYAYASLDGAHETSRFFQNGFSYWLMVWAVWFPLVLAFVGALVVLLVPLRRAQRAVAQPSGATDWSPSVRPVTPGAGTPPHTPAPTMAGSIFPPPANPNDATLPYASSVWQGPQPNSSNSLEQDAPATSLLPVQQAQPGDGALNNSPVVPDPSATRMFSDTPAPVSSLGGPSDAGTFNLAGGSAEPSWLLQPVTSENRAVPGASDITGSPAALSGDADQPAVAPLVESARKTCPNCGAGVMPGAIFCTECGSRLTS